MGISCKFFFLFFFSNQNHQAFVLEQSFYVILLQKVFRFPYLKNDWNDEHFDLEDPNHLVGKTLLWMCEHVRLKDIESRSIRLIGALFFEKFGSAKQILTEGSLLSSALPICRSRLEQLMAKNDENKEKKTESEECSGFKVCYFSDLA